MSKRKYYCVLDTCVYYVYLNFILVSFICNKERIH